MVNVLALTVVVLAFYFSQDVPREYIPTVSTPRVDIMAQLPGASARLERPRVVTVRYLNTDGAIMHRVFEDLESTSVQHQIDHLAGRMYFDRLGRVKRDMLLRRARKVGA